MSLTTEEREAGFLRPIRTRVTHKPCGMVTAVLQKQAEDMARDPKSWSTCWCMVCGRRLPIDQFLWTDGAHVGS